MNLVGIKLAIPAMVLFALVYVFWRTTDALWLGLPTTVFALLLMNFVCLGFAVVYVVMRSRG